MPFVLRISPEQKRDLQVLRELLDGTPSMNGLIQTAISVYLQTKLADPQLRAAFNVRVKPRLEIVG